MNKKMQWLLQRMSLKLLILAGVFLVALFVFAFIAHEAVLEHEDQFDAQVHTYLLMHTSPSLLDAARLFTFMGSSLFLLPAYTLLIGTLIIFDKKRAALDISLVAASSFLMMQLLKRIFHRQRPNLPVIKAIHTYSFPSGHSLSAFIFCSILAFLVWKTRWQVAWKWLYTLLLSLLALAVGLSRIVLNVHFATDVIAGFCLGVMWVVLSFWIIERINRRPLL